MSKIIFSHIALFLANLIYAINYIFAKDVMPDYITPKGFILIRVLGASIVFYILYKIFIKEKIHKKDWYYLIICAVFGVVINMLCFFEGLNITTPINASLIMITTPLIVYSINFFMYRKERNYKKFIGVMLGLIGAGVLITNGKSFKINNLGDFLVFLNASSYALYLILIKSMMNKYHPITILKTIFTIGLIIILPIAWEDVVQSNIYTMPLDIVLKALFVVFFTTCGAYFLNIYAITNLDVSSVAFYIYLQPLLATLLAIALGKDILTSIKLIASAFIFTGTYFVLKRNKG